MNDDTDQIAYASFVNAAHQRQRTEDIKRENTALRAELLLAEYYAHQQHVGKLKDYVAKHNVSDDEIVVRLNGEGLDGMVLDAVAAVEKKFGGNSAMMSKVLKKNVKTVYRLRRMRSLRSAALKFSAILLTSFSLAAQTVPVPTVTAAALNPRVNLKVTIDVPNTNGVSGLLLLWGDSSRTYTNSVKTAPASSVTISNLPASGKYFFAAMTQSTNGQFSPLSNELMWPVPTTELVFVRASTADTIDGQRTVEYTKVYTNPPGMKFTFLETWKETR